MDDYQDNTAISSNPQLQDSLRLGGIDTSTGAAPVSNAPMYRVMANSKLPVAKSYGKLWKSRIDQSILSRKDAESAWSEAIKYYENDQLAHRQSKADRSGNTRGARTLGTNWLETENVVFSTAVTMLPMLYSKNPSIEATPLSDEHEDFASCVEKVIDALLTMKEAPGVNLKSKARRGVLSALLTNNAYLKIGWVQKVDSSTAAITELQNLTTELTNAATQKDIAEVEGKITGLMEKITLLEPSGPTSKLISPFRVFVDPTAREPDHSDANWMAEYDFLPTAYIRAVYGKPGDNDSTVSAYEPTHVLNAGASADSIEDQVNSFTLINNSPDATAQSYGYKDNQAFVSAQYTKVWWVWDKTTRRVFLYADNSWEWPLWVWDDPLQLLRFFPYFRLWFHETADGAQPKGEVTYYLDQQDAINEVNSEIAQARKWARRNVFFNKNAISQDDVEQVLKGPDGTARGLDVPEGQKTADLIFSIVPPALAHPELFDNTKRMESISRITGVNDALRGGQFKTNTTNKAVQAYEGNTDVRVDEKMDAIEDWIGDFAWSLTQLCLRYWTVEDVTQLVGQQVAQAWQQVNDSSQLRKMLYLRVIGGSLEKPTSKAKKQEALEMGQVIGQFANSIPAAGLLLMKVFERAFDNFVVTEEDWDGLQQSMQDAAHQAGSGPGGASAEQGDPNAAPGVEQPQGNNTVDPAQAEVIKQQIMRLPPDLRQHMEDLVNRGVSPTDALKEVTRPHPAPSIVARKQASVPMPARPAPGHPKVQHGKPKTTSNRHVGENNG